MSQQLGMNIVGVQFRRAGKIYDFSAENFDLTIGDYVIVDSERGPSLAEVVAIRYQHPSDVPEKKIKPIVRKASLRELNKPARLNPEEVSSFTWQQVKKLGLNMKILKSEVQFGGNKVIVYFTAPGRVDFRELVKDLASGLKTRIELKQIGARDETKLLGGLGICGREYCCSSFLREFVPVSIRMAKNQNLALNPSKVSGGCGRLLCCLTYENDTYSKLRQHLPPRGVKVRVIGRDLVGLVVKTDLLNQLVSIDTEESGEIAVKVDQIEILDLQQLAQFERDNFEGQDDLAAADAEQWAQDLDLEALQEEVSNLDQQELEKDRREAPKHAKNPPASSLVRGRPDRARDGGRDSEKTAYEARDPARRQQQERGPQREPRPNTPPGRKNPQDYQNRHRGPARPRSEQGSAPYNKEQQAPGHSHPKKRRGPPPPKQRSDKKDEN